VSYTDQYKKLINNLDDQRSYPQKAGSLQGKLFALPTGFNNFRQERGRHNLKGFSIEFLPVS